MLQKTGHPHTETLERPIRPDRRPTAHAIAEQEEEDRKAMAELAGSISEILNRPTTAVTDLFYAEHKSSFDHWATSTSYLPAELKPEKKDTLRDTLQKLLKYYEKSILTDMAQGSVAPSHDEKDFFEKTYQTPKAYKEANASNDRGHREWIPPNNGVGNIRKILTSLDKLSRHQGNDEDLVTICLSHRTLGEMLLHFDKHYYYHEDQELIRDLESGTQPTPLAEQILMHSVKSADQLTTDLIIPSPAEEHFTFRQMYYSVECLIDIIDKQLKPLAAQAHSLLEKHGKQQEADKAIGKCR